MSLSRRLHEWADDREQAAADAQRSRSYRWAHDLADVLRFGPARTFRHQWTRRAS